MSRRAKLLFRAIGLVLLATLIWRLDAGRILSLAGDVSWLLLIAAVALNIPHVVLKSVRWRKLLRTLGIDYPASAAVIDYFTSLLAGFVTPGRLGELLRAWTVRRATGADGALAFGSVVADRLFDLYALSFLGLIGLFSTTSPSAQAAGPALIALIVGFSLLVAAFLSERTYRPIERVFMRMPAPFARTAQKWLGRLRIGLRGLSGASLLGAFGITGAAYAVFALQCLLVARATHLPVGLSEATYAVALGSLVTLLPISISGIGTRDVTIVAFLATVGVSAEPALTFSLLIFATFYVGAGLMGVLAWLLKPVPLSVVSASASDAHAQRYWDAQQDRRLASDPTVEAFAAPKVRTILDATRLPPQPYVLDVACGNGYLTYYLPEQFRKVGLDLSLAMLDQNPCKPLVQGSALDLPFRPGSFDLVVTANLLHHLDEPASALSEMVRVTRRYVAICEPNRLNPLMLALGLSKMAERGVLRSTPSYMRRLASEAGIDTIELRTAGFVTPTRMPAWVAQIVRRWTKPSRFAAYTVLVGRKRDQKPDALT